ncbi:hypothetical protein [Orenia marismortui]|uniref:Uncharacterized protein n=1 Tax=Orenia marismortui TaxID=46469 RepID=A0A4R8GSM9_9FIRM|nr:hypothetical protein [Orenia marismortui]TDX48922.1 hypothetical protein C7959_12433 [Orenia marismortui]
MSQALMEELESTATIGAGDNSVTNVDQELIKQKFEEHQEALKTYLEENHSDASLEDILGGRDIKEESYSILPLSLPYKVVSVQKEMDALSDSYRQKLSLKVEDMNSWETSECNYTASIPELGSKRISISYVAATEEDAEIIQSYLPEAPADGSEINPDDLPDSLPAHLINVKPQIRIDGEVKATGDAVKMGTKQSFQMKFSSPAYIGLPDDTINNEVIAGAQYVVTLDTGRVSQEELNHKQAKLKAIKQNLENKNFSQVQPETITGDILHTIGLAYFAQLDMFNKLLAQKNKVKSTRITSASITAVDLNVSYMFGQPRTASAGGLYIDVDRDLHVSMGSSGDEEQVKAYNMASGMISSYLEGSIFEQTFGGEAVSTMHILNHANQQGIPVYTINQENVDTVIPELEYDSAKKQEFRNLINNGKEITVPERDVTISGWSGTGYIVLNPDDGIGAYMISGGLNGGEYTFGDYMNEKFLSTLGQNIAISLGEEGIQRFVGLFSSSLAIFIAPISYAIQSFILLDDMSNPHSFPYVFPLFLTWSAIILVMGIAAIEGVLTVGATLLGVAIITICGIWIDYIIERTKHLYGKIRKEIVMFLVYLFKRKITENNSSPLFPLVNG